MNDIERKEKFINDGIRKFGDKFDYSKVEPFRNKEKDTIIIICPEHGEFIIHPKNFLNNSCGCPKCGRKLMGLKQTKHENDIIKVNINNLETIKDPIIVDKTKIIGTVYCFRNKINNKLYFGETVKSDYRERFTEHRNKAFVGNIINYFYNALRKYQWDGFDKFIVFQTEIFENTLDNKKYLNEIVNLKEKEYINLFNTTNSEFGYNLTEGGDGVLGYKFSEETKIKMSESHKGEKHWNFGNRNGKTSKPILQFDLDFNFIKEWPSAAEIARELNINANNITNCCNNKLDTYKNFIWVRKCDYYDGYLNENKSRAKCKSNDKPVLQFDFNGNFIKEYISASEASRELQCSSSLINKAATGKEKQGKKFLWIYKQDFSEENLEQKVKEIKTSNCYKQWLKQPQFVCVRDYE